MEKKIRNYSRREFVKTNTVTSLGALMGMGLTPSVFADNVRSSSTPALMGGQPIRTKKWPGWPMWIPETDEQRLLEVMRSGVW